MNLRARLSLAVITTTALVVALAATATWLASSRARGLAFDQEIRDQARRLRPDLEHLVWKQRAGDAPVELLAPDPAFPGLILVLRDARGRILARSAEAPGELPGESGPEGVLVEGDLPGTGPVRWMTLALKGRPLPGQDDRRGGRDAPPATLVLLRPTREFHDALAREAGLLAVMGLGICGVTALLVVLIVNRLLRPIARLGDGIAALHPATKATLAVPGLPTELVPVQARLNELLTKVDQVLERERQTTANIAHELRTPLASLRVRLELALRSDRDPGQVVGVCRQGLATVNLLQGLVDNLLLLARLEAGQAALHREAVEVAEVVAVAWTLHQPAAEERSLTLQRTIEPALSLTTDAGKLRAILGNLLANAVTYADAGTVIALDARETSASVVVTIANDGATIAPGEAERVFEPFWRGDAARTVDRGHCGLGLPLVRRLAIILGGTISVTVEGRRFTAILRLPGD